MIPGWRPRDDLHHLSHGFRRCSHPRLVRDRRTGAAVIIHIPVFVAIDVAQMQPIHSDLMNAIGTMTMTLRFDTEDSNVPVECCDHYPPRPDAFWSPALALVDLMKPKAWNRLIDRVIQWPMEYAADQDEGMRREVALRGTSVQREAVAA